MLFNNLCQSVTLQSIPKVVITGAALTSYHWAQNAMVQDDLVIYATDNDVTDARLSFLQSVEVVLGSVIVEECPGILSLSFLKNLRYAKRVVVKYNDQMFNASLPLLERSVPVFVEDCDLLCPRWYPIPSELESFSCELPRMAFETNTTGVAGYLQSYVRLYHVV